MKYRRAADVLPDELLREVQKYVNGEGLYFPKQKAHKKWGEASGARSFYARRNEAMGAQFRAGASIEQLAEQHNLSMETVRKIIYEAREK